MKTTISVVLAGVVMVSTLFGFKFVEQASSQAPVTLNENKVIREEIQLHREMQIKNEATIIGGGDVLISNSVSDNARNEEGFDFIPMFEKITPYINEADFSIINLETMHGSQYPASAEVSDALKGSGFNMLTLVNSHTLENGEEGVLETINHLNDSGLPYTGAYESQEDKENVRIIEINNISFAFLSYSQGTNGMPVPEGKDHLISLIEESTLESEIREAKEMSDVVVLNLHYGEKYTDYPNEYQTYFSSVAAEAGADIIFGHHPQVLQPFEWLKTSDGREVFVAYSLGNLISGQEELKRRIGGLAQVTVKEVIAGPATFTIIDNPRFIPVYTDRSEGGRNFTVLPPSEMNNEILVDWENHFDSAYEHVSQWMNELEIGSE
ncbi:CapA family protein [Alteribacter keqinensis]|uniref:CapA family protein n=1 Tax=Alteribacter keqinensis TaxID=2483800 RepID=A0A3M7TV09_9BACI|nr:CapA family protein [Alteribacter keqinensis]RNA69397.1 CapA family protein [Alteribacter keqinensis]